MGTPRDEAHTQQAKQLFERALDIRTRAFGASDMRVAEILTPLANLTGDELLYQRALTIVDSTAPQSAMAATTLELYSRYLAAHDRGREGEPLETRAKQIRTVRVAEIGARQPYVGPQAQRMSSGITAPKLKQKTEPEYSDAARADKVQGTVVLKIVVDVDGLAHDIQLVRGVGLGLDEKAAEAIGKWQFIPGSKNGQTIPVAATVEVNFRLM
jgi:TonB family protein